MIINGVIMKRIRFKDRYVFSDVISGVHFHSSTLFTH